MDPSGEMVKTIIIIPSILLDHVSWRLFMMVYIVAETESNTALGT
jgi:hypothetical protein